MNIYTQHFRATCSKNGRSVDYVLTIESPRMILVEDIQVTVGELKGYHEEFADLLWQQFGGRQRLVAHHHGTDVETVRP